MKFRIQFQVGHTPITIEDEAQDTKEFFQKAAFVHSLPKSCGACGKDDIIFEHRIVQSYEFYDNVAYEFMLRQNDNPYVFSNPFVFYAT